MTPMDFLRLISTEQRSTLWKLPYICFYFFNNSTQIEKHVMIRLIYGSALVKDVFVNFDISLIPNLVSMDVVTLENGIIDISPILRESLMQYLTNSRRLTANSDSKYNLTDFHAWELLYVPLLTVLDAENAKLKGVDDERNRFITSEFEKLGFIVNGLLSNEGMSFLFSDITKQMWTLLTYILSDNTGTLKKESFCLLIRISMLLEEQKPCNIISFDPNEREEIFYWNKWGIVSIQDGSIDIIKPLLLYLTSPNSRYLDIWNKNAYLESNFCIYMYTSSPILVALLRCFSKVLTILPDMCVSQITRKSALSAFRKGITTHNIMDLLSSKKHYLYIDDKVTIEKEEFFGPLNESLQDIIDAYVQISSQLALWEAETNRFTIRKGILLKHLDNFEEVLHVARENSILLWHDAELKLMFVSSVDKIVGWINKNEKM